MENKTAVEWLIEELNKAETLNKVRLYGKKTLRELFEKAKEIDRQQSSLRVTKDSWDTADKLTHNGYIYVRYNDLIVV